VLNGGARIGPVEHEGDDHAPGACQIERLRFRPPRRQERGAEFGEIADQHEIDRVARQAVAGDGEARHALALQDLQAHAHDARQDHIGRERID
jgi:hypothetical protein